ncbi:MAG: cache domain-containing protein [Sedimentisphaerales bacterium]|nr:cache domain-containing protein [Sedimentisphaerales bacterium]
MILRKKPTEPLTLEDIRLSARRNKILVLVSGIFVLAIAGSWALLSTHRFQTQTIRINQEHLLDIARIEARLLKNLLQQEKDSYLETFTSDITVGEKGYIWIIDRNGVLLSHPDKDQIGKDMIAIRKEAFPDYDWSSHELVNDRMRKGEEGIGVYQSVWWSETEPEASRKLVGFSPVNTDTQFLSVAVCMSYDEIAGPIRSYTLRTFTIAGMAIALFGMAGRIFYRSQQRENQALQQEVAEHKKTRKALQEAHDRLEQCVEDRTVELRNTNKLLRKECEERTLVEERNRDLAKFPSEDPNPVLRISVEGTITYANKAGELLLEELGTGPGGMLPEPWDQIVREVYHSEGHKQVEVAYGEKMFSLTLAPVKNSGYVNLYGLDVTERKILEQEILKINDMVQGSVGRDLHDGLLQQLTGVTFFCDTLVENLADKSSPYRIDAQEIAGRLRRLTNWVRDLAKGLYPADLETNGLGFALERLASTASHLFSISVTYESDGEIAVSNPQTALHLYRIAQEAMNNAVKHGNAKHICIRLSRENDKITLAIIDDGSGFSGKANAGGMGLQSIHYRAKAIGAVLEICPGETKGAIVRCVLSGVA